MDVVTQCPLADDCLHVRQARTYWILWYAIAIHAIWGVCLLFSDDPTMTTPIHELSELIPHHQVLAVVLLLASTLAGWSAWGAPTRVRLAAVLPQQVLLVLSTFGAIAAISHSAYADGVVRPQLFILADQSPAVVATVCHTLALLQLYGGAGWLTMRFRSQRS